MLSWRFVEKTTVFVEVAGIDPHIDWCEQMGA